jgi:hypothetical protein
LTSFTKQQPKHGDTIMHCGHIDDGKMHWFQYEAPIGFLRPDQTRGEAEWFAACESCFVKHGAKVTKRVRGDGVWTGDAPAIEKEEN